MEAHPRVGLTLVLCCVAQCNHGMGYDASRGRLVFTDRANHRLVFTDDSGAFVAETPLGEGGLAAPCNVDVSGDFAITASLGNTDGMQVRSNPCTVCLLSPESFSRPLLFHPRENCLDHVDWHVLRGDLPFRTASAGSWTFARTPSSP